MCPPIKLIGSAIAPRIELNGPKTFSGAYQVMKLTHL